MALVSKSTVLNALAWLALYGFLDKLRPIVRTSGLLGPRVRQTSNAYVMCFPKGLGGLAANVFGFASEFSNWIDQTSKRRKRKRVCDEVEWHERHFGPLARAQVAKFGEARDELEQRLRHRRARLEEATVNGDAGEAWHYATLLNYCVQPAADIGTSEHRIIRLRVFVALKGGPTNCRYEPASLMPLIRVSKGGQSPTSQQREAPGLSAASLPRTTPAGCHLSCCHEV